MAQTSIARGPDGAEVCETCTACVFRTYPIVAIDVAAAKATVDPSDGRARMKAKVAASQIVRIGLRKRLSTLWKNFGIPRSRAFRTLAEENISTAKKTFTKRKHHPAVACQAEKPTMPNTYDDQCEQDNSAIFAENVQKNLQYRLSSRSVDSPIKVLD